jgi:hypothetical protein
VFVNGKRGRFGRSALGSSPSAPVLLAAILSLILSKKRYISNMRLSYKYSGLNPKIKKRRIVKFLLFPRTINGDRRWLEHAIIEQKKVVRYRFNPPEIGPSGNYYHWENSKWIN